MIWEKDLHSSTGKVAAVLVGMIAISLAHVAYAASLNVQQAIDLITNTADKICNVVSTKGEAESSEVKGEINAQLSGLAAKLADVGISGSGSINNEQYQNVLRKDLPTALQNNATCKYKVFNTLQAKLLGSVDRPPNPDTPGATKNAQDLRLEQAIMGTWRYTLKPPSSSGVPEFELLTTYVRDGEAIQRGSAIYQGQTFPIAISGKWSIRSGILHYKVESSNVAFLIPEGSTYEGEIITITDGKLTQINLADGQRIESFRVR